MSADVVLPKQLKIVGWAFIFVGFLALIGTLYTLFNTPMVNINFLMVFIFIGYGLLKRRSLARNFAIACSFVVLIFTLGDLIVVLSGQKSISGLEVAQQISFWAQTILGLAVSGYALWALQSKAVRDAFEGRR